VEATGAGLLVIGLGNDVTGAGVVVAGAGIEVIGRGAPEIDRGLFAMGVRVVERSARVAGSIACGCVEGVGAGRPEIDEGREMAPGREVTISREPRSRPVRSARLG
jgi:hypothetical protein